MVKSLESSFGAPWPLMLADESPAWEGETDSTQPSSLGFMKWLSASGRLVCSTGSQSCPG